MFRRGSGSPPPAAQAVASSRPSAGTKSRAACAARWDLPRGKRVITQSEAVAGGQAVLTRRAVETGQDAQRRDVVAGRAVFLVGQVRALQREGPGIVDLPDQAGAEQAVARLLDLLGQVGGRIDLALVGVGH